MANKVKSAISKVVSNNYTDAVNEVLPSEEDISALTGSSLFKRKKGIYNRKDFKDLPQKQKDGFSKSLMENDGFKSLSIEKKQEVFDKALHWRPDLGLNPVGRLVKRRSPPEIDSSSMVDVYKGMVDSLGQNTEDGKRKLLNRYLHGQRTFRKLDSTHKADVLSHVLASKSFETMSDKDKVGFIYDVRGNKQFRNMDQKDRVSVYGSMFDNIDKLTPKEKVKIYNDMVDAGSRFNRSSFHKMDPESKAQVVSKIFTSKSFGSLSPNDQRDAMRHISNKKAFKDLDSAQKGNIFKDYLSSDNLKNLKTKDRVKTLKFVLSSKDYKSLDDVDKAKAISGYLESKNFAALKPKTQKRMLDAITKSGRFKNLEAVDRVKTMDVYLKGSGFQSLNEKGKFTRSAKYSNKYIAIQQALSLKKLGGARLSHLNNILNSVKTSSPQLKYLVAERVISKGRINHLSPENAKKLFDTMLSPEYTKEFSPKQLSKLHAAILNSKAFKKLDDPQKSELIGKALDNISKIEPKYRSATAYKDFIASKAFEELKDGKIIDSVMDSVKTLGVPTKTAEIHAKLLNSTSFKNLPPAEQSKHMLTMLDNINKISTKIPFFKSNTRVDALNKFVKSDAFQNLSGPQETDAVINKIMSVSISENKKTELHNKLLNSDAFSNLSNDDQAKHMNKMLEHIEAISDPKKKAQAMEKFVESKAFKGLNEEAAGKISDKLKGVTGLTQEQHDKISKKEEKYQPSLKPDLSTSTTPNSTISFSKTYVDTSSAVSTASSTVSSTSAPTTNNSTTNNNTIVNPTNTSSGGTDTGGPTVQTGPNLSMPPPPAHLPLDQPPPPNFMQMKNYVESTQQPKGKQRDEPQETGKLVVETAKVVSKVHAAQNSLNPTDTSHTHTTSIPQNLETTVGELGQDMRSKVLPPAHESANLSTNLHPSTNIVAAGFQKAVSAGVSQHL